MKQDEELAVITKTYDLILWSCNHTGRFPRNHRFVLGERMERNLYDLLETLIRAKYTRQRQPPEFQDSLLIALTGYETEEDRRRAAARLRSADRQARIHRSSPPGACGVRSCSRPEKGWGSPPSPHTKQT